MNRRLAASPEAPAGDDLRRDVAALRDQVAAIAALLARVPRIEVSRFPPGDEHLRELIDGLTAERDTLRAELRQARATAARQTGELVTLTRLNVALYNEIASLEGQLRDALEGATAAASPAPPAPPPATPALPAQRSLPIEEFRGSGFHALEHGAGGSFAWLSPEVRLDLSGLVARLRSITFDLLSISPEVAASPPLARFNGATCVTEIQMDQSGRGHLGIIVDSVAAQSGPQVLELLFEHYASPPGDARHLTVACNALHLSG